MITTKAIKPKALNDAAMHAALVRGMMAFTETMGENFDQTTQTWETEVEFQQKTTDSPSQIVGECSTTNEIYTYVSEGTRRHWVGPINGQALAFPSGYAAKSSPGRIPSAGGGASGPMVFSKGHYVSGIEPRKFDVQIKNKLTPEFAKQMTDAMSDARKASGHAI